MDPFLAPNKISLSSWGILPFYTKKTPSPNWTGVLSYIPRFFSQLYSLKLSNVRDENVI
jgi:hypothetical protein